MTAVRYHRLAEQEAGEAVDWYESKEPGLGARFIEALRRAELAIAERPKTWPRWPDTRPELEIRRFLLTRFPYGVAYLSDESPVIIAVAHLRRRPLYWLDRAG